MAILLSDELKARHLAILVLRLPGYRTIVVHGYLDRHSLDLGWEYIQTDLPAPALWLRPELAADPDS